MRGFVAACFLAVAASAATIEQRLVELQKQDPSEPSIMTAAANLRAEIVAEQEAADAQHVINQASCDFTAISARIASAKASITLDNSEVNTKTIEMGEISTNTIPSKRDTVASFHDPINADEAELAQMKKTRDLQHAEYNQAVSDIIAAVQVIDEIRVFIQNSTVDNAGTATVAPGSVIALLESEARLHRGLKGQLMRTAASALMGGSVDSIYEILYKMRNEFKDQLDTKEELENNEYVAWHELRMDIRQRIGNNLIAMEEAKQGISNSHTRMAELEAEIAALNVQMAKTRYALNDDEMTLEQSTKLCNDMDQRYTASNARRTSTLATIDLMTSTLNQWAIDNADKLAGLEAVQSNLNETTPDVTLDLAETRVLTPEEQEDSGATAVDQAMSDLKILQESMSVSEVPVVPAGTYPPRVE